MSGISPIYKIGAFSKLMGGSVLNMKTLLTAHKHLYLCLLTLFSVMQAKFLLLINLVMVYIANSTNSDQIASRSSLIRVHIDSTERKVATVQLYFV